MKRRRWSNSLKFIIAIPIPIRRCHLVNRSTACFPGQESVDWSVAIVSVAPTNITSGSDMMKEPFTTQVTYTRFELLFQQTAVLSCDPCPHGRYVYVYANSSSPSTIQLCEVAVRGDGKSLHDVIPCGMTGKHIISPLSFLSCIECHWVPLFTISLIEFYFIMIFIIIVTIIEICMAMHYFFNFMYRPSVTK